MRLFLSSVSVLLLVSPLLADDAVEATEYRRASIVERSPFAKSDRGHSKAVSGGPLELRGFYGAGDTLEVSLTRQETKESSWIRVGDKNAKWVVNSADPIAGTADVKFDGMSLHLTLAKAEAPETPVAAGAPAPVKEEQPQQRRDRPTSNWGKVSEKGREAFFNTMRDARKEHPELYTPGAKLTPEQEKQRDELSKATFEKAKAAVSAISPEDAANLPSEMPQFGGRREGGQPREGGNNGGNGGGRGNRGGNNGGNAQ